MKLLDDDVFPELFHWIMWFFFVLSTGVFLFIYSRISRKPYMGYLVRGFLIKAVGGLAFAVVYIYYYNFGDTFRYYFDAVALNNLLGTDTMAYFRLMAVSDMSEAGSNLYIVSHKFRFIIETEGWYMVRICSIGGLFTMNTYLGMTFFTSLLSFVGGWQLFKLSNYLLDNNYKWSFAIAFLIPSTIFWGGGVLKDTYTMVAVSIWALAFYKLLHGHGRWLAQIFWMILCSYVIYKLKSYILISMMPWFFVTAYLAFTRKINMQIIRIASIPVLLALFVIGGYYVSESIVDSSEEYNAAGLEDRAEGFQSWHETLGGSYYDLGEISYTPLGILSLAPKALAVTLFRPYPWEVGNAFMVLNSIEGLLFLGLFLWSLNRARQRFFSIIYRNAFLFGVFLFCILFGVAVGLNSYNFGALARYKLPMLSLSFLLLFYVGTKAKKEKEARNANT